MAATKTWIVLTESDVRNYCVAEQKIKLDELEQQGENNFGVVYNDVVAEIRTAIASNPANTLSATANSIPPELKRWVSLLVIEAMSPSFSNATPLTPPQIEQVKKANEVLDTIRNWKLEQRGMNGGGFYISQPTNPESGTSQSARPTAQTVDISGDLNPSVRLYTRETLAGL